MEAYRNAYTEVYEILNSLQEEEYNKIPKNVIEVIEEDRNTEYEYILDEELTLSEHPMLPETRAILFNIFRDYLATPEEKEKILKMQAEERRQNEEKKRQEYYANKPQEEKIEVKEEKQQVELIQMEYKETFWDKIKNMLGAFLKKK